MKKMFFPALFFLAAASLFSQETPVSGSYLIPQTIYVGDRGRLVSTLGQVFSRVQPFVSTAPEALFSAAAERKGLQWDKNISFNNLVVNRVELDNRGGTPRLIVDFVSYVPGLVVFPPMLIQETPPLEISGLSVNVASILKPQDASLAEPADPLAAPGTGLIVYSTMAFLVVVLFFFIGGGLWGREHFAAWKKRFYRRRLLRAMDRLLRRLKAEWASGGNSKELFAILSAEFREFLSFFTGLDCRALTPGEFDSLDLDASGIINGVYLHKLFSRWELIRFGGSRIGSEDFLDVLNEVRSFIVDLDKAERNQTQALAEGAQI